MIKRVLCSMPLLLKCFLGTINTLKNREKCAAISEINNYESKDFPLINTQHYSLFIY